MLRSHRAVRPIACFGAGCLLRPPAKNKGIDEGKRTPVGSINHAALFCSGDRSYLTRITLNNFPKKFTQLLLQGDGFGEAASHQRSSRDSNRVLLSLSADTQFRAPWTVSSPS